MNRRIPNGTYGGVRGRRIASYSILRLGARVDGDGDVDSGGDEFLASLSGCKMDR